MNTLTTEPVKSLISRLFAEAELSDANLRQQGSTASPKARENLHTAGLSDLVDIREGDALETLARDLPETIDLVLLDGAKGLYSKVLSLLEGRLRVGALIVADNADYCPDYLARVRASGAGYLSVPFADDIEVSMRT